MREDRATGMEGSGMKTTCERCGMTTDNAPNEFWVACGSFRDGDGIERISDHCNTRVKLRDALDALKDLAEAAERIEDTEVPSGWEFATLDQARKRALIVLEVAS
jgi:hypothetical protein